MDVVVQPITPTNFIIIIMAMVVEEEEDPATFVINVGNVVVVTIRIQNPQQAHHRILIGAIVAVVVSSL